MKIVLFDMDGTLTEPRKEIGSDMIRSLLALSNYTKIGIVTGSDFDYVMQQCKKLFDLGGVPASRIEIFPCNGTKHYTWQNTSFNIIHEADMLECIGQKDYNYLIQTLLSYQLSISLTNDLPYTGTFFHYRGSMLNWCPIGRQAGDTQRKSWVEKDLANGIRSHYLSQIEELISSRDMKVSVALGGSTSFDIYPSGWDKTYVLNHLEQYDSVYFVGDRCEEGGNDYHIYRKLKHITDRDTGSFVTSGPEDTIKIVDNLIRKLS